jgi:drug/metabolite transporter superfamily protein YnfA
MADVTIYGRLWMGTLVPKQLILADFDFNDFGSVFADIGTVFTIFSILKEMTRDSKSGHF